MGESRLPGCRRRPPSRKAVPPKLGLKEPLSHYIRQVEAGAPVTITVHGKPVGRIMPIRPQPASRLQGALEAGWVAWSGRKLTSRAPVASARGDRTVADRLLEGRE